AAPSKNLAPGIQNTGPMELRPPIDANKDVKLTLYRTLLSRHAPPQDSATAANVAPVLALKRRGLPTVLSATGHPDETRLHIGRYAILRRGYPWRSRRAAELSTALAHSVAALKGTGVLRKYPSRLKADAVVNGAPKALLAPQVSLRRFHRNVPQ